MSQKQNTSTSTRRSDRNKGKFNKKDKSDHVQVRRAKVSPDRKRGKQVDSGLLSLRRTTRPVEFQTHEEQLREQLLRRSQNLESAKSLLVGDMATRLKHETASWTSLEAKLLACDYVKSLVYGDGQKPAELSSVCARVVEDVFLDSCPKRIVGVDTLPGQRILRQKQAA